MLGYDAVVRSCAGCPWLRGLRVGKRMMHVPIILHNKDYRIF